MAKQALILYYSQFGDTARIASKIHEATGADIVRIKVPDDTFPLDMEETGRIYQQQLKTHDFPKLVTTLPDLSYYDLILVGGPVWNGKELPHQSLPCFNSFKNSLVRLRHLVQVGVTLVIIKRISSTMLVT